MLKAPVVRGRHPMRPKGMLPLHWVFAHVVIDRASGCWTCSLGRSDNGYSSFTVDGKHRYCHRLTHEALRGPIPEGLVIDHRRRKGYCG